MYKDKDKSYSHIEESSSSDGVPGIPIFGGAFEMDPLPNPTVFLPQYMANQRKYEPSVNEMCQSCCGKCCMTLVCPFGCCGCTGCSCIYILPTSKGRSDVSQLG